MTTHSPLGASTASRFLNCPGSPRLISSLGAMGSDPLHVEEWTRAGSAAHDLAAAALVQGLDAWELSAHDYGWPLLPEDLKAVQVYLDYIRSIPCTEGFPIHHWVECPVEARDLHPGAWGTLDWAQYDTGAKVLDIVDYKHGVGVVVDVERNEQAMTYAFYKLRELAEQKVFKVRLSIVQPRAPGVDPIRTWETTGQEILDWGYNVLIPGMVKTETSDERRTGKWCQFCPAKLRCPEAVAVYRELSDSDTASKAIRLSDHELGDLYRRVPVAAFVRKAVEQEVLRRQLQGSSISGAKLVAQKADRVWKTGADAVFGGHAEAWSPRKLKSPAQMEEVTALAALVKTWAYKPDTGYTTAPADDRRKAITLQKTADAFAHYQPGGDDD